MSIIKGITELKWDLSKKGFKDTVRSFVSLFTDEKKLRNWVYLYTFIMVPVLNYLIILIQVEQLVPLHSPEPTFIFSPINIVLTSILLAFTIFSFILSLLIFSKVKPVLFTSLFTQIIILFLEINIFRKYALSLSEADNLIILFLILVSLSILFVIIHLLKMIYLRIRARIILKRELKY